MNAYFQNETKLLFRYHTSVSSHLKEKSLQSDSDDTGLNPDVAPSLG